MAPIRTLSFVATAGLLSCGRSATMARPVDYISPTVNLTSRVGHDRERDDHCQRTTTGAWGRQFLVNGQAHGPLDQSAPFTTSGAQHRGTIVFGATAYDDR
jgi:hypothetical protein